MSKKKKSKIVFCCDKCGHEHMVWQGQCDGCKEWNTLVEFEEKPSQINPNSKRITMVGNVKSKPTNLKEIKEADYPGFSSYINELDRVLGGKVAYSSVTLIAAEPGTGKSTLLLQTSGKISEKIGKVLYATGEESEKQIKERATRLGINSENLFLYNTEDLTEIAQAIEDLKPKFVVVDSIQHILNPEITGEPGDVKQIRSCASGLVTIAKKTGIPIFIVGHVTKDDSIAGPRKLEHVVDTVLYLENDEMTGLKMLRAKKNRFGSTEEVGVFKMEERGLIEVPNPSEHLIANRSADDSGSAIICTSGKRAMLIEVQSLVVEVDYQNAIPTRTTKGFSRDNLNIIIAVLAKKCGITLGNKNVYVNVAGGISLKDPGADLGVALAIASSQKEIIIDPNTVIVGEIGLNGEVRPIKSIESLIKEAEKNGFNRIIIPEKNFDRAKEISTSITIVPVKKVREAIKLMETPKKK